MVFALGGSLFKRLREIYDLWRSGCAATTDAPQRSSEAMAEHILIVDEIVLVRWQAMTSAGVQRVLAAIDEVWARGVLPLFIGMVGDGVAPPTGATNLALAASVDDARRRCSSVNLVLDGAGLASAAIRTGATVMFLVKGDPRTRMYRSLDDALADRARDRVEAVRGAAAGAGLLTSR